MVETHLVSGSSGYLGKKIVERLLRQGFNVIGVDIKQDPKPIKDVRVEIGDIRDSQFLKPLLKNVQVVYHNAALVPLTRNYGEFKSVNEFGSQNIARVSKLSGVETFVHTSSSAIFGASSEKAIDSTTKLKPIEPYGWSKLRGEILVGSELENSDTRLVVIRPRTILGTERGGIFDLLFRWIRNDQPIFTIGKGDKLFQFIQVDDLVDAILLTVKAGVAGEFNVGTNRFGTLNEAFENLKQHAHSRSNIVHLPVNFTIRALSGLEKMGLSPLAPWHYKTYHLPFHFDVQPLLKLGWAPRYSNDEMLSDSFDSYLNWSSIGEGLDASPHRSRLEAGILPILQRFFK